MLKFLRELVSDILLRRQPRSYSENQKMRAFSPELVSDILLHLPVKSLLRFRCLSTSLCSDIDSLYFVNSHLNRSNQNQMHQKLILNNRNGTHFYTLDFEGGLKEVTVLNYPFKPPCDIPFFVCGSCNGLILLVLRRSELTLWNPFTRRYKNIPPCPVENLPGRKFIYLLGLGHDSALDDYKIVVVLFIEDSNQSHISFPSWVFSLKRNSWRRNQDDLVESGDHFSSKASFANGTLYWQCEGHKILAFDLSNEAFFNIPLSPDSGILIDRVGTQKFHVFYDTMAVFGGKLYTTKITAESKTLEFYLNMSDKGGQEVGASWKKAFEMEGEEIEMEGNEVERALNRDRFLLPRPLTYSKDGASILFYVKNEAFWYNPETKSCQWLEILGIPPDGMNYFSFNVCWESLVSLGNEGVFDAAPEIRNVEKLRKIAEKLRAAKDRSGGRTVCEKLLLHEQENLENNGASRGNLYYGVGELSR